MVNMRIWPVLGYLFPLRKSRRAPDPALPKACSRFTTAAPLAHWLWSPPTFAALGLSRIIEKTIQEGVIDASGKN